LAEKLKSYIDEKNHTKMKLLFLPASPEIGSGQDFLNDSRLAIKSSFRAKRSFYSIVCQARRIIGMVFGSLLQPPNSFSGGLLFATTPTTTPTTPTKTTKTTTTLHQRK
jgi:hypothetical protein